VCATACNREEKKDSAPTKSSASTTNDSLTDRIPVDSFAYVYFNADLAGAPAQSSNPATATPADKGTSDKPGTGTAAQPTSTPSKPGPRTSVEVKEALKRALVSAQLINENAGVDPTGSQVSPLKQAVAFMAGGLAPEDQTRIGFCARDLTVKSKLDAFATAAKAEQFKVTEKMVGSHKGYLIAADVLENPSENPEEADLDTNEPSDTKKGTSKNTDEPKTREISVYAAATDSHLGVSTTDMPVVRCLEGGSDKPTIFSSPDVKRLFEKYPISTKSNAPELMRAVVDLSSFKTELEKRVLESSATAKPGATPGDHAAANDLGITVLGDQLTSKDSLEHSLALFKSLPSSAFLVTSEYDPTAKSTLKFAAYFGDGTGSGGALAKELLQSKVSSAVSSLPTETAVLVGIDLDFFKRMNGGISAENPYQTTLNLLSDLAIGIVSGSASSAFPDLHISVKSPHPAELGKSLRSLLEKLSTEQGLPFTEWQTKKADGISIDFYASPFGVGIYMADTTDALLVSSSEQGLKSLVDSHKQNRALSSVVTISPSAKSPVYAQLNGSRVASLLSSLQSTLQLFGVPKEISSSQRIDEIKKIGKVEAFSDLKDGFGEFSIVTDKTAHNAEIKQ
jgi:hypothetical protein